MTIPAAALAKAIAEGRVTDASGKVVTTLGQRKPAPVEQVAVAPGKPGLAQPNIVPGFTMTVGLLLMSVNEAHKSVRRRIQAIKDVQVAVTRAWEGCGRPVVTTPYRCIYQLVMANPMKDPSNVLQVFEKGALDALQACGAIKQDNALWDLGMARGPAIINPALEAVRMTVFGVAGKF